MLRLIEQRLADNCGTVRQTGSTFKASSIGGDE